METTKQWVARIEGAISRHRTRLVGAAATTGATALATVARAGSSAVEDLPIKFADAGVTVTGVSGLLIAALGLFGAWIAFRYVMKAVKGAKA